MKVGGLFDLPHRQNQKLNTAEPLLAKGKVGRGQDDVALSNKIVIASRVMSVQIGKSLNMPEQAKAEPKQLFDFEEVAKNVLKFVKGFIGHAKADGASDEDVTALFEKARAGVTQGIEDAVGELKETDLYSEEVETGIEQSRDLIFNGIDEYQQQLLGDDSVNQTSRTASFYQYVGEGALSIETNEGDKITLSYGNSSLSANYQDNNGQVSINASSSRFELLIEGDLNQQEQEAINKLIADLESISSDFFNGSLEDAMQKAQFLSFDVSQLASMALNLQKRENQGAIKQYQQDAPLISEAKKLAPLAEDLSNAYNTGVDLNIEKQLEQIISWLNQKRENAKFFINFSGAVFNQLGKVHK